jgi:hypothetical protein
MAMDMETVAPVMVITVIPKVIAVPVLQLVAHH